jgi:hypothetical protein
MKVKEIEFDEVVSAEDIENGNVIICGHRLGFEHVKTFADIIDKHKNRFNHVYFDFFHSVNLDFDFTRNINIVDGYKSSVEIIKHIEMHCKYSRKAKFVFIDGWEEVEDKGDWFVRMLVVLSVVYRLVILISSRMPRRVDSARKHLPKKKVYMRLGKLSKLSKKHIYITNPSKYYKNKGIDKIQYYLFKGE